MENLNFKFLERTIAILLSVCSRCQRMSLKVVLIGMLIVGNALPAVWASDVDPQVLLDTLVETGILTPSEARVILERSRQKMAARKTVEQEYARDEYTDDESTLGKIGQRTRLQGDLTVRYAKSKTKSTTTPLSRQRGRVRYRLGIMSELNDQTTVGAGLTSSDGDSRSSFQTFGDSFEKKEIRLDYAYGQWAPVPWVMMIAGKFPRENYLWSPSDMMWDSDIRPEGGAVHLETPQLAGGNLFLNAGAFVLEEQVSLDNDPTMTYLQPGVAFDNDVVDFKVSMNRYMFNKTAGVRLDHSSCTNRGLTLIGDSCVGSLINEYDSAGASFETGLTFPVFEHDYRLALFGDYIENLKVKDDNIGFAGGIVLGSRDIKRLGDWQASYQYTLLQKEAVLDIFPNSDRYEGQTDVRGIKTGLGLGLSKNVRLNVNYYRDDKILATKARQSSVLADVGFKF